MTEALVFGGHNSLDFLEVREGVLRIPEVGLRIEMAQKIWDKVCGSSFSFQHFLSSGDNVFFNNIQLKILTLAVVQLGLLDRYKRLFSEPEFIVGNARNDSALLVAIGKITFEELISQSQACGVLRPMAPLQIASEALLHGMSLPQYQAFQMIQTPTKATEGTSISKDVTHSFKSVSEPNMDINATLLKLVDDKNIKKIVHIGPGTMEKASSKSEFAMREIQIYESIDIDPMLGWFWTNLRKFDIGLDLAQ